MCLVLGVTELVLHMSFDALSGLASAVVVWKLLRLPPNLRSRDIPRLLLCLSGADLLFHSILFVRGMLAVGHGPWPVARQESVSHLAHWCGSAALALSIWFELAVSAAYLVRSYRCARCVVPWLPHAAAVLASASFASEVLAAAVTPVFSTSVQFLASGLNMLVTSVASCACLGVVAWRARQCGDAVEQRCLKRSGLFLANALVTELPWATTAVLMLVAPRAPEQVNWNHCYAGDLSRIFLSLTGAANACTFFWQCRYSGECIEDVGHLKRTLSFDVHLSEHVDEIERV